MIFQIDFGKPLLVNMSVNNTPCFPVCSFVLWYWNLNYWQDWNCCFALLIWPWTCVVRRSCLVLSASISFRIIYSVILCKFLACFKIDCLSQYLFSFKAVKWSNIEQLTYFLFFVDLRQFSTGWNWLNLYAFCIWCLYFLNVNLIWIYLYIYMYIYM